MFGREAFFMGKPLSTTLDSTKYALTSGMLTALGMASVDYGFMIDGIITAHGGYIINGTSAGNGGLIINFGTPVELGRWRENLNVADCTGAFKIQYGDNGSSWSDAGSNSISTLAIGWNVFDWANVGAHQYWRCINTATSNNQGWWCEVEVYAYI